LLFQKLEKALGDGVVLVIPTPAHADIQIVLIKERLPLCAGELGAFIRVDQYLLLWFALLPIGWTVSGVN
jgi:hypothetical protein